MLLESEKRKYLIKFCQVKRYHGANRLIRFYLEAEKYINERPDKNLLFILNNICKYYDISENHIKSKLGSNTTLIRSVYYMYAKDNTYNSPAEIGAFIGFSKENVYDLLRKRLRFEIPYKEFCNYMKTKDEK